jgi:hypothetical protein
LKDLKNSDKKHHHEAGNNMKKAVNLRMNFWSFSLKKRQSGFSLGEGRIYAKQKVL